MRVNVEFHNVNPSVALRDFIKRKSRKLGKFLRDSEKLNWVVDFNDKMFNPHLNLALNGQVVSVHAKADDPYRAASEVLHKAQHVLSKRHDKRVKSH
jgi:ribosomal subunit interface protein